MNTTFARVDSCLFCSLKSPPAPPRKRCGQLVQDTNTFSSVYTGTYYMTANIHITNGATLEIDGNDTAEQGGCKTLLLVRPYPAGRYSKTRKYCAC